MSPDLLAATGLASAATVQAAAGVAPLAVAMGAGALIYLLRHLADPRRPR